MSGAEVLEINVSFSELSGTLEWCGNVPKWFQKFSDKDLHLFEQFRRISHSFDGKNMSFCDGIGCDGKRKGEQFFVCKCQALHKECANQELNLCSMCHSKPYQVEFIGATFPLHQYYSVALSVLLRSVPRNCADSPIIQKILRWIMKRCDLHVSSAPKGVFIRLEAFGSISKTIQKISRSSDPSLVKEMASNFKQHLLSMQKPLHDTSVIRLQPRILPRELVLGFEDNNFRVNSSTQARFLKIPCHRLQDYCFSVECPGNGGASSLGECKCGVYHMNCSPSWKPRTDKSGVECGGSDCNVCKKTITRNGVQLSNVEAVTLRRHAISVAHEIRPMLIISSEGTNFKMIRLQLYNFLVEVLETSKVIVDADCLTKALKIFLADLDKMHEFIDDLTLKDSFFHVIDPRAPSHSDDMFCVVAKEPSHEMPLKKQVSISVYNLVHLVRSSMFDLKGYTELSVAEFVKKYLMSSEETNPIICSTVSLYAIYQGLCHRLNRRQAPGVTDIKSFGTLLAATLKADKRFQNPEKTRVVFNRDKQSGFKWDMSKRELRIDNDGGKRTVWTKIKPSDELTKTFPQLKQ